MHVAISNHGSINTTRLQVKAITDYSFNSNRWDLYSYVNVLGSLGHQSIFSFWQLIYQRTFHKDMCNLLSHQHWHPKSQWNKTDADGMKHSKAINKFGVNVFRRNRPSFCAFRNRGSQYSDMHLLNKTKCCANKWYK